MHRRTKHLLLLATIATACMASAARADTIEIRRDASKQTISNIKVRGVTGDQLTFTSESGNDAQRPLANVFRIEITGEPAFNDAENAYAAEKWPDAAAAYQKALGSATKPWMKDRISLRLVDVAGKTGQFDAAVAGWSALVVSNPTLADTVKPDMPANKDPKQLKAAAAAVDKAASATGLTPATKLSLLQFELQLDSAAGDKSAAGSVIDQILKSGALNPDDPASQKQFGDFKVVVAQLALDDKDYTKAKSTIDDSRKYITDPDSQAAALYVLAEVQYQQNLSKNVTDKTVWQDTAIAFMRVVSLFPSSAPAADALARTGACEEKTGDTDKASKVYAQVAQQYPNTPAAKLAADATDRLKAAGK